jgi:micrococcal nuclease
MDYKQINILKPKSLWRLLFIIALFLVLTPFISPKIKEKISEVKQTGVEYLADEEGYFKVSRIIDGDTIELFGGIKVRYIGIDTPEKDSKYTKYECYSNEATSENKKLLKEMKVKLVEGNEGEDKYGRLLRYVYLEDGTFVNLKLIEGGFANVMSIPPNLKFKNEFEKAEKEAIKENKGMWKECLED